MNSSTTVMPHFQPAGCTLKTQPVDLGGGGRMERKHNAAVPQANATGVVLGSGMLRRGFSVLVH